MSVQMNTIPFHVPVTCHENWDAMSITEKENTAGPATKK